MLEFLSDLFSAFGTSDVADWFKSIILIVLGFCGKKIWEYILKSWQTWRDGREPTPTDSDHEHIVKLDHSNKKYEAKHIKAKYHGKKQFIPIPESKRLALECPLIFPYNKGVKLDDDALERFIKKYYPEIKDIDNCILEIASQTADHFINKKKKNGSGDFNKDKFGIYHLSISRTAGNEQPTLNITVFKTDYFTFRCMGNLYQYLYNKNPEPFKKINDPSDLDGYSPFLCSLGTGGIVYADNKLEKEIFLGKRAKNINAGGFYHLTFTEGFNTDDIDNISGDLCVMKCLKRGLHEELHLNDTEQTDYFPEGLKISHILLVNDGHRLETVLECYAKIKFDDEFNKKDLLKKIKTEAQDGAYEFEKMEVVELSKAMQFVEDNTTTPECKYMVDVLSLKQKYKSL